MDEEDELFSSQIELVGAAFGLVGISALAAAVLRMSRERSRNAKNAKYIAKSHDAGTTPGSPPPSEKSQRNKATTAEAKGKLPPVPTVDFRFKIGNLSYGKFEADPALVERTQAAVVAWLSAKTGATEDCVEVSFRPGSLRIEARIKFPEGAAHTKASSSSSAGAASRDASFACAHACAQLDDPFIRDELFELFAEQPGFDALKEDPRRAFVISSVSVEEVAEVPEKTRESDNANYGRDSRRTSKETEQFVELEVMEQEVEALSRFFENEESLEVDNDLPDATYVETTRVYNFRKPDVEVVEEKFVDDQQHDSPFVGTSRVYRFHKSTLEVVEEKFSDTISRPVIALPAAAALARRRSKELLEDDEAPWPVQSTPPGSPRTPDGRPLTQIPGVSTALPVLGPEDVEVDIEGLDEGVDSALFCKASCGPCANQNSVAASVSPERHSI
jgi:hypothetical protein